MNIKSEFLQKTVPWFPSITLAMLMTSVVLGSVAALLIISLGWGLWIKLFSAIIGVVIILVWTFDTSVTDKKDRDKVMKQGLVIYLLAFVFAEIPLYLNSTHTTKFAVSTVWTKEVRNERIPNSEPSEYKDVPFEKVAFYNMETNERMGSRVIETNETDKKKLYSDIIGKEYYIEYFPFFSYYENYRYIRVEKPKDDSSI